MGDMTKLLLIAAGGGVGAVLRFLVAGWVQRGVTGFPIGTLTVNVVGCLLIGFLGALATSSGERLPPELRFALMIGVLGGFTTFSTFGLETIELAREHEFAKAALYIALSNVIGLAAVWLGYRMSIAIYGV
jgi:CrcB protein